MSVCATNGIPKMQVHLDFVMLDIHLIFTALRISKINTYTSLSKN